MQSVLTAGTSATPPELVAGFGSAHSAGWRRMPNRSSVKASTPWQLRLSRCQWALPDTTTGTPDSSGRSASGTGGGVSDFGFQISFEQVSVLTIDIRARTPELRRRLGRLVLVPEFRTWHNASGGSMRSLLVMGVPYQHAPEVSIVRTDTCRRLNAQLACHGGSLSARSGSVNSED